MEPVTVSGVITSKQVDEKDTEAVPTDTADLVVAPEEHISISETVTTDSTKEIKPDEVVKEYVRVTHTKKRATVVSQVETTPSVEPLEETKPVEDVAKPIEEKPKKKVKVTKPVVQTKEVEDILKPLHVEEFGPGEQPMKELATVGVLLRKGVTVDEVWCIFLSLISKCHFNCVNMYYKISNTFDRFARCTIQKNSLH